MNRPLRALALVAAAAALLAGCNNPFEHPPVRDCPEATPELAPPAPGAVADTLAACGGRYALACELWRDFQPISEPNGDPLAAVVTLTECDSLVVPDGLLFDHLWVVDGTEFWSTGFNDPAPEVVAPYRIRAMATCGPKWDTGSLVDVVVAVRCAGAAPQYVRVRDVPIRRTD